MDISIKRIFIALVIACFIGLIIFLSMVDGMVKDRIEGKLSDVLEVEVTVGDVDMGVFSGSLKVNDLMIGNPESFSEPYSLKVAEITADFDTFNMLSSEPRLHQIVMSGAEMMIEPGANKSNIHTLVRHASGLSTQKKPLLDRYRDTQRGRSFLSIKHLVIQNTTITSSAGSFEAEVEVPKIELYDLGTEKPTRVKEIMKVVLGTLLGAVGQADTSDLPAAARSAIRGASNRLKGYDASR